MSDSGYIDELARALTGAGIPPKLRGRIITEFEDHLAAEPGTKPADLGSPVDVAAQFADELGTDLARRAALNAFVALAIAGLLFVAMALTGGRVHVSIAAGVLRKFVQSGPSAPVVIAVLICAVAAQVAVVSGVLGAARALRLRSRPVLATDEAVILVRRATVALAAGAVTMLALPIIALSLPHGISSTWRTLAYVATGAGLAAIAAAVPSVRAAVRLRPNRSGAAGDLIDDLTPVSPISLPASPWTVALIAAAVAAAVITAAGIVQSDPYDGALRGLADGLACLAGFAALGPFLGLRSRAPARAE